MMYLGDELINEIKEKLNPSYTSNNGWQVETNFLGKKTYRRRYTGIIELPANGVSIP